MKATLRRMGNSQGVLIPKAIVEQLGIKDALEMTIENNAIVLRCPAPDEVRGDAAIAAMKFALEAEEGMAFLRCWMHGDFKAIRKEWPEAPEAVFVGADPAHDAAVRLAKAGGTDRAVKLPARRKAACR